MTDADKVATLRRVLLSVLGCFKSRTESSTCIEDHHPTCAMLLEETLRKVDEESDDADV